MSILLVLVVSFAPGLFWLWYFYRKDKFEPEPLHLVRNCFFWGMAAVVPAVLLEWGPSVYSSFLTVVVVAPIVEELAKFCVVWVTIYKHPEFDEPMDGVVYATAVALGFASLENVGYLWIHLEEGAETFATVGALRALLSVPGHALWACIWGYALGVEKFRRSNESPRIVGKALLLAMLLHGAFNLVCWSGPLWAVGMLVLLPIMWKITGRRIREALELSPHTRFEVDGDSLEPTDVPEGKDGHT
jgi:protease PrsW